MPEGKGGGEALARLIEALPPDRVKAVQMNDGTMAPALDDYKDDCLLNRVAPGDGEMHAVEFTAMLLRMGVTAPWSLEVCRQGEPTGAEPAPKPAFSMANELSEMWAVAKVLFGKWPVLHMVLGVTIASFGSSEKKLTSAIGSVSSKSSVLTDARNVPPRTGNHDSTARPARITR